jgi:hypothetical protein
MGRLYYEKDNSEKRIKKEKQIAIKNAISDWPLGKKIDFYKMSIKYWWSGDEWLFAQEYALAMMKGWKR